MRTTMLRMLGWLLVTFVCGPASVRADEVARGFEFYMSECSKCHGVMEAGDSAAYSLPPIHLAMADDATVHSCIEGATLQSCGAATPWLAIALPFGPDLAGIMGRKAGSVPDFEYSRAFIAAFEGSIWDESTLDEYIADSQLRAPGVRMFYRQPDAGIRHAIIEFLKTRP